MAYELSFYLSFELMSFYWFLYYEIINWELNHWNSECCTWELRCWNWKSQLKYCNWNVLTFWLKRDIIFSFEKKSYWKYKNNKKKRRINSFNNNNSFDFLWLSICFAHNIHCFVLYSVLCFCFILSTFFFISFHWIFWLPFFFLLKFFIFIYFILIWTSKTQLTKHSTMHFTM